MSRRRIAMINRIGGLDGVSKLLQRVSEPFAGEHAAPLVKDALNGVWMGHPLHPAAVSVPIGAWTLAAVLDLTGHDHAADIAVATGIAGAGASAASGLTQYYDYTNDDAPRRVGAMHAVLNSAATACYIASAALRLCGNRNAGRVSAFAGLGIATGAALLGGDMIYTLGLGVDRAAFEPNLAEWVDVAAEGDVEDSRPKRFNVDGASVLVTLVDGQYSAISAICTHLGGPLEDGEFDPATCGVTCPWHGSVFDVRSGKVLRSPATSASPRYEVKAVNGRLLVRSA